MRAIAACFLIAACGGGGGGRGKPIDAAHGSDAHVPAIDSGSADLDLACDPTDSWFVASRGPGTAIGDAEPASPDEVGDSLWHLFVGVNESQTAQPDVYIYDATAAAPDGAFALPASPDSLPRTRDTFDQLGSETPSYLRADAHHEYVYYCAIESTAPLSSHLAAFERVDGGAWTKLGIVAPNASDEITLCEPNVVLDPATGAFYLQYLSITTANRVQERSRTSSDPTTFDASTIATVLDNPLSGVFPNRVALSRDAVAGVWRTSYDVAAGNYAMQTVQTWSASPSLDDAALARAATLHDGAHALHLQLHTDFSACDTTSCPQGAVLQPSKAIYPNASDVIFYYSGWNESGAAPQLQVNGQRCHRG